MSKVSHVILSNMAYLPTKELGDLGIAQLKARLTIANKFDFTKSLILYDDSRADYFGIPMYYWKDLSIIADKVIDKRMCSAPISFSMKSTPREDQARVLGEFDIALSRGVTGALLNAPPGWGKTRTGSEMIQKIGQRAIIVVPKSDLVGQWKDRLIEHTTLRESDIGTVEKGKSNVKDSHSVVVGLVHSLALERFHYLHKQFGTVFFDEVHMSVPPQTFAPVARMYTAKYRLAASATLNRDDGWGVSFEYYIGQTKFVGDASTNRMTATAYIINYPKASGALPHWVANGRIEARASLISMFAKNKHRTDAIAQAAVKCLNSGRRLCVISDRTSILVDLQKMLTQRYEMPSEKVGFFCSSLSNDDGVQLRTVTKKEQNITLAKADIILGTYGLMSTGTDIPSLSAILLATPQSKVTQTKGRVERIMTGKKYPVVMDWNDSYYDLSSVWLRKRIAEYKNSGVPIKNFSYDKFLL